MTKAESTGSNAELEGGEPERGGRTVADRRQDGAGKYLDNLRDQSHSSPGHKDHSGAQPLQVCTGTDRHGGCTPNSASPGGRTDRLWGVGGGPG